MIRIKFDTLLALNQSCAGNLKIFLLLPTFLFFKIYYGVFSYTFIDLSKLNMITNEIFIFLSLNFFRYVFFFFPPTLYNQFLLLLFLEFFFFNFQKCLLQHHKLVKVLVCICLHSKEHMMIGTLLNSKDAKLPLDRIKDVLGIC